MAERTTTRVRSRTQPAHLSSKPQHPSRRVPPNAYPHHAGWKAKVSFLLPFDAYSIHCTSIISVVRAARQIHPDSTHQINNHTLLLLVHMGIPRGVAGVARTKRYLGRLLSAPAQLVNWRLVGWSVALAHLAQIVSKRCVRGPLQVMSIDPCAVPVIHAASPSTTIRNAMTQHSRILTTTLICYTTSAVAFAFFHVISSTHGSDSSLRFFVKSKYVLPAFGVVNVLTS